MRVFELGKRSQRAHVEERRAPAAVHDIFFQAAYREPAQSGRKPVLGEVEEVFEGRRGGAAIDNERGGTDNGRVELAQEGRKGARRPSECEGL